jgi:hypothetical protein
MTKKIILTTILSTIIGLTGCTSTPEPVKYNIDKEKNIEHIERSFDLYKEHKSHKAMAIAMDSEGKYVLGYSYDCTSAQSAEKIALNNCTKANERAEVKADASCELYAVEDNIVHKLK